MALILPESIESEEEWGQIEQYLQQMSHELLVNLVLQLMREDNGRKLLLRLREDTEQTRSDMLAEYDEEILLLCEERNPSVDLIEANVRIMMEYLEAEDDLDLKAHGYGLIVERMQYAVDERMIGLATGDDWRLLMMIDECQKRIRNLK